VLLLIFLGLVTVGIGGGNVLSSHPPVAWLASLPWLGTNLWQLRRYFGSLRWRLQSRKGLSFRRYVDVFPLSPNASASIYLDRGCQDHDGYGDDNCHFNWGTTIKGNYTIRLGQPLEAEDYMDGHLKFDDTLHYHFKCAMCGQDCNLQLPVIKANITIPMDEECPVKDRPRTLHINKTLWKYSPSDGLITTKVEGTVYIIQGRTGDTLVEFRLQGSLR